MRELKGKVAKETRRDKRERREENHENKNNIMRVVIPTFLVLITLLVSFVWVSTRPKTAIGS